MKKGAGKGKNKCRRKEYAFFFSFVKVETKKHFILEFEAFKDNRENYGDMRQLTLGIIYLVRGLSRSWEHLFWSFHRKMAEYIKHMKKNYVPYVIFSLVDVKIISLFLSSWRSCPTVPGLIFPFNIDHNLVHLTQSLPRAYLNKECKRLV